jgi:hypothetical protein
MNLDFFALLALLGAALADMMMPTSKLLTNVDKHKRGVFFPIV